MVTDNKPWLMVSRPAVSTIASRTSRRWVSIVSVHNLDTGLQYIATHPIRYALFMTYCLSKCVEGALNERRPVRNPARTTRTVYRPFGRHPSLGQSLRRGGRDGPVADGRRHAHHRRQTRTRSAPV